jgi:cell division septum initiation protein DivIVA
MAGHPAPPPSDAGFEVVRRGYDQGQVDAHLRRLDAEVSILVTDRDAALSQAAQLARELDEARVRAERLRAQVRTLASPQQSPRGASERIRSMLRLAEDEVAEMLARAESEAIRRTKDAEAQATQAITAARADVEAIREEGRTHAEKMRQEIEQERAEFDLERAAAIDRLAADRTATEADLAARHEAAEDERARAWAESEARRELVEEDFTIAMAQRRAEALAALTAERETARRELQELRESAAAQAREVIARAEQQARENIAEAERRVAELMTARTWIAEQLGRTRTTLDDILGSLALPPEQLDPAHAAGAALPSAGIATGPAADPAPGSDTTTDTDASGPDGSAAPRTTTARTADGDGADQAGALPTAHDVPDDSDRTGVRPGLDGDRRENGSAPRPRPRPEVGPAVGAAGDQAAAGRQEVAVPAVDDPAADSDGPGDPAEADTRPGPGANGSEDGISAATGDNRPHRRQRRRARAGSNRR